MKPFRTTAILLTYGLSISCSDGDSAKVPPPTTVVDGGTSSPEGGAMDADTSEESRPQDSHVYNLDESILPFAALAGSTAETDRIYGVLGQAGYRIEVPKNWNGMLVMFAHGFTFGDNLAINNPPIRQFLIENGYAWAASSYSKNGYDVRGDLEDTNTLAENFVSLVAEKAARTLSSPSKIYFEGNSMGGHVAAASVEEETLATANHKVHYDGVLATCGVLGDIDHYKYVAAYQLVAQHLAGFPASAYPSPEFTPNRAAIQASLFETFPTKTTPTGDILKGIVSNLTGGARVGFDQGFAHALTQSLVWSGFGGDGGLAGVLTKSPIDTHDVVYQIDADPGLSAEEKSLNDAIFRATGDPDANRLRRDGLRWVPLDSGKFKVPVVTLHTLGDLFVPFVNEQIYRRRAIANGSDAWLVQRVVRGVAHCEFTNAELVATFQALVDWEQRGMRPEGDEILDPNVVGAPDYGCKFTVNTFTDAETTSGLSTSRASLPVCVTR